ncbi:VOC family protein [Pseudemcibacter aquimaris]|uniref:VOC family protein n=1 Tax=Pseudemcibacter aquimaris TaxID=2857064 RepID=UPI0020134471|nr:VOC family protein [Pseudemcibacter aquimaris]MCC3859662.1 VOC family protein [Pseudemcibacter aquimaris]WDU60057.1 VOC family protein [Pseudemcibacter aquimaris]
MIGYTMVGVSSIEKSSQFYDTLFAEIGAKRQVELDDFVLWTTGQGKPSFAIGVPYNGNPATVGNGVMFAFPVAARDDVHRIYDLMLENGATCDGGPGERGGKFYMAYFRDPDGNKLAIYKYEGENKEAYEFF